MYLRTSGIILKGFDFKEADQIITLFSREMGKISAIAKGVKKPKSSLRGLVQPFCHSDLYLVPSGGMYIITQGKIIDFFGEVREDLDKTIQALYIMELLDKSLPDRDPNPPLYTMTLKVLSFLGLHTVSSLSMRFYEIKLLSLLGYEPVLGRCAVCDAKDALSKFNPAQGGVLCPVCASSNGGLKVSPATLAALRTLQQKDLQLLPRMRLSPTMEMEMEAILEAYLEYYLERRLNLKDLVKGLKGKN